MNSIDPAGATGSKTSERQNIGKEKTDQTTETASPEKKQFADKATGEKPTESQPVPDEIIQAPYGCLDIVA